MLKLFGLWFSWFCWLNGKEVLYGIGGLLMFWNGDGSGGGGFGYLFCCGIRIGGNINKRREEWKNILSFIFFYCVKKVEVFLSSFVIF